MGLKAGRKLLLTSGCSMLIGSEPLLPQVQNEEISFITQHISMDEVANSFWRAMQPETMDRLTAADLNGINAIISLALPDELDQSLAGVTLPSSLQTLTFGRNFDQSLAGVTLPNSLQILTFGRKFNQSLAGVTLPDSLQSLTFGRNFNQSLAGVALPHNLQTLTFGLGFNQSLKSCFIPCNLRRIYWRGILIDTAGSVWRFKSPLMVPFSRTIGGLQKGDPQVIAKAECLCRLYDGWWTSLPVSNQLLFLVGHDVSHTP